MNVSSISLMKDIKITSFWYCLAVTSLNTHDFDITDRRYTEVLSWPFAFKFVTHIPNFVFQDLYSFSGAFYGKINAFQLKLVLFGIKCCTSGKTCVWGEFYVPFNVNCPFSAKNRGWTTPPKVNPQWAPHQKCWAHPCLEGAPSVHTSTFLYIEMTDTQTLPKCQKTLTMTKTDMGNKSKAPNADWSTFCTTFWCFKTSIRYPPPPTTLVPRGTTPPPLGGGSKFLKKFNLT